MGFIKSDYKCPHLMYAKNLKSKLFILLGRFYLTSNLTRSIYIYIYIYIIIIIIIIIIIELTKFKAQLYSLCGRPRKIKEMKIKMSEIKSVW